MYWDAVCWLVLMVLLLIMEANTVSLVSLWFAAGALVAMVGSLLGAEIWLQVVLFFGVSGLLLVLLAPIVRRYIKPRIVRTNVDAVIGKQGYVTEAVDNLLPTGQVKLGGMPWTARSENGEQIPKGALVEVVRIEGVKALVKIVEETRV